MGGQNVLVADQTVRALRLPGAADLRPKLAR
jgi:hypothetical protein